MQVCHRKFGYTSNTEIIYASKLSIGIRDFNANYNSIKIYKNFKAYI